MTARRPWLGVGLWALCTLFCLVLPVTQVAGFGGHPTAIALARIWMLLPCLRIASAMGLALLAYQDRPPLIPRPWLGRFPGVAASVLYGAGIGTLVADFWGSQPFALEHSSLLLLGGAFLYGLWSISVPTTSFAVRRWAARLLAHRARSHRRIILALPVGSHPMRRGGPCDAREP